MRVLQRREHIYPNGTFLIESWKWKIENCGRRCATAVYLRRQSDKEIASDTRVRFWCNLCLYQNLSVGAFIGRPPWWYCLLIHITFDVMKIMYSILHAMRAIVCNAHERENTVLPYIITTTLFHLWIFKQSQSLCRYLRASNERPYRIAQTKKLYYARA